MTTAEESPCKMELASGDFNNDATVDLLVSATVVEGKELISRSA